MSTGHRWCSNVCRREIWGPSTTEKEHTTAIVIGFSWQLFKLKMSTSLTTLWKFFYRSPQRCESFKEVQKVLDLSELKNKKTSDTRGFAHEKCVTTVKRCYNAIVTTPEKNVWGIS